ncbi:hypothetical protein LCGC14_1768900, partial [marine sediment metagenome]
MKKILFVILVSFMVSLMVSGQSAYKTLMTYEKGIKIGENGTVHDSLKLESGVLHMYFGATDIPLANEDTTIQLRIEIDNATDTSNIQTTKINTNIQSASDNSDSITIHRDDLDSLFSLIAILIGDAENPFPAP